MAIRDDWVVTFGESHLLGLNAIVVLEDMTEAEARKMIDRFCGTRWSRMIRKSEFLEPTMRASWPEVLDHEIVVPRSRLPGEFREPHDLPYS